MAKHFELPIWRSSQAMVRKPSFVWNYFVKESNSSSKCKLCNKVIRTSGNTTNLMAHLRLKHQTEIDFTNANNPVSKSEESISSRDRFSFGRVESSVPGRAADQPTVNVSESHTSTVYSCCLLPYCHLCCCCCCCYHCWKQTIAEVSSESSSSKI